MFFKTYHINQKLFTPRNPTSQFPSSDGLDACFLAKDLFFKTYDKNQKLFTLLIPLLNSPLQIEDSTTPKLNNNGSYRGQGCVFQLEMCSSKHTIKTKSYLHLVIPLLNSPLERGQGCVFSTKDLFLKIHHKNQKLLTLVIPLLNSPLERGQGCVFQLQNCSSKHTIKTKSYLHL